jgi:uncharacterized protein YaaR (DUF327 family)
MKFAGDSHETKNEESRQKQMESFKKTLSKEIENYIDWSLTESKEKLRSVVDRIREKVESHFKRNPKMSMEDLEGVKRAVKEYAHSILHSEVIPQSIYC